MGVLVDQQQARPARQRGVEIELEQRAIAVVDRLAWENLQVVQQGLGLAPAMGLDHPDQDVAAAGPVAGGGAEHGVGLAHARAHAEEDLQPAAPGPLLLALERSEQRIGSGSGRVGHGEPWQRR